MKNEKNKYQYVFSMKLAGILMTKGFKLLRINRHLSGDGKDVYVFEWTQKIHEEVENYIKAKDDQSVVDKGSRSKS